MLAIGERLPKGQRKNPKRCGIRYHVGPVRVHRVPGKSLLYKMCHNCYRWWWLGDARAPR